MTISESIPFVGKLIAWYKTWRDEKRAEPLLTPFIEIRPDARGTIDLWMVIHTDATVTEVAGTYSVQTTLPGYGKPKTDFWCDAVYPAKPLEEHILYIKVTPAGEIRSKEAEITVPIFFEYTQKTGEKEQRNWKCELKRGESQFRCKGD